MSTIPDYEIDDEIPEAPGGFRMVRGDDDRPEVKIRKDVRETSTDAIKALSGDGEIYQRGGLLVRVIAPAGIPGAPPPPPEIRGVERATLLEHLSSCARWIRFDGKAWVPTQVPDPVVSAVLARGQWEGVRPLLGVVTAPTLRPDGSVVQSPGYDEATGLIYRPAISFVEVPESPSLEEARGAAEALLDLVCDFPFATEADRSAWLAGVLTVVGRSAITGPCPLFAIDGTTRGAGKSKLVDVAVRLACGHDAERSTLSANDEELRKQITGLLLSGSPCVLIDNVRSGGKLGGPAFDAVLTSTTWKERLLGQKDFLSLPARAVWWATGNNLQLAGDLSRRALRIRLASPLDNPEERTEFRHPDLLAHVSKLRKFLVAQALIILRAHAIAGRPQLDVKAWGSFEEWSRIIAAAIRWIGHASPLEARASADETLDEERMQAGAVIAGLADLVKSYGRALTAKEIVSFLYPRHGYRDDDEDAPPDPYPSYAGAREALEAATYAKSTPVARDVGKFLQKSRGRVVDGRAIASKLDSHAKVQRWHVVDVDGRALTLEAASSEPAHDAPSEEPAS
jgi:hypothetical protein